MRVFLVSVSDDRMGRKGGIYAATQKSMHDYSAFMHPELIHRPYTWGDIERSGFYKKHHYLLHHIDPAKNGRAYKPYVINETINEAAEGDFIIYNDCSPELWNVEKTNLQPHYFGLHNILKLCADNNGILSQFIKWDTRHIPRGEYGIHTHRHFTTELCINFMGMQAYRDSFMHASGMMVFKVNNLSREFVKLWLRFNLVDNCCALGNANIDNDYSYWDAEDTTKMGHRHDQSISGLLVNHMNPLCVDFHEGPFPGHNYLNYCIDGRRYDMIDTNTKVRDRNRIFKGDTVKNSKGVVLTVFEIRSIDGVEWILVGHHKESLYRCLAKDLTKV